MRASVRSPRWKEERFLRWLWCSGKASLKSVIGEQLLRIKSVAVLHLVVILSIVCKQGPSTLLGEGVHLLLQVFKAIPWQEGTWHCLPQRLFLYLLFLPPTALPRPDCDKVARRFHLSLLMSLMARGILLTFLSTRKKIKQEATSLRATESLSGSVGIFRSHDSLRPWQNPWTLQPKVCTQFPVAHGSPAPTPG